MNDLESRIDALARVPVLLVGCDYDGTLARIVEDPAAAWPNREAVVALRRLAELPRTHVAVISGRALADLARLSGLAGAVHLVGSHGSEFEADFPRSLSDDHRELLETLRNDLRDLARDVEGARVEEKPASVALHVRGAQTQAAEDLVERVRSGPARLEGVYVKEGKKVIELSVVEQQKGKALDHLRSQVGASAVLFLGDDVTDEDAFARLRGPDVGVKVGNGATRAGYRIDATEDVSRLLGTLFELRRDWAEGGAAVPIEQHALLSDQRTVALVTPEGRVVWGCFPRVDSPAMFAEILGGPTAGHFSIRPADAEGPGTQAYAGSTFVLETRWDGIVVRDFLDCSDDLPRQRPGRSDLIRTVEGEGRVVVEFAPRMDFGRLVTQLTVREGGLEIEDTIDPIVLAAPGVTWTLLQDGPHHTARADLEVTKDAPLVFELRYGTSTLKVRRRDVGVARRSTARFWSRWARALSPPPLARDAVRRSALVLRALTHGPSGAIVAAATTSLPEAWGGVRNWDYRFCWLRDAAMAARSLLALGARRDAMRFVDWVLHLVERRGDPARLRPVYTVTGGHLQAESEIGDLPGYAGSRPVRVGNAASAQAQLDVFGPVLDLVLRLAEQDAPLSSEHWRLCEQLVQAVERRWRDQDHGIWELRLPRQHHVHSRLMCWVAADRGVRIARLYRDREVPAWEALREAIAEDVLRHGYDERLAAFTHAYDLRTLDASTLQIGLSGLLAPDDPRFVSTVEAVERHLREGPAVHRYRMDDGLPGREGGFLLCTGWLVQALCLIGRVDDGRALFEDLLALAGPTGLLPEEYDAGEGRTLGNHPQAYSHIAVIDAAICLAGHGVRDG